MATKPSTTIEWAELALYTQGSGSGYPTKLVDPLGPTQGSIPGKGVVAQFYNFNMHLLGKWTEWLDHGTSDPDIDAHIIETNANGTSKIATLEVGGQVDTISGLFALDVTNNSDAFATAASFTNVSGGFAILAESDGSSAAIRGVHTGGSFGVEGLGLSSATAGGVKGQSNAVIGVRGETQSGKAGSFAASSTGDAVHATAVDGMAINATATGATADAIHAYVSNGSANGSAIKAFASASADGIYSYSEGGNAGIFETGGTLSPVRIVPRFSQDPATIELGGLWFNNLPGGARAGIGIASNTRQYLWGTEDGLSKGFGSNSTPTTISGSFPNHVSMTMSVIPESGGYVEIDISFTARPQSAIASSYVVLSFQIFDVTAGVEVADYDQRIPDTSIANDADYCITKSLRYLIPGVGTRVFRVDFQTNLAALNLVQVRDCVIKGEGIFKTIGSL